MLSFEDVSFRTVAYSPATRKPEENYFPLLESSVCKKVVFVAMSVAQFNKSMHFFESKKEEMFKKSCFHLNSSYVCHLQFFFYLF